MVRRILFSVSLLLFGLETIAVRADDATAPDFFEKRVRPVLVERCYSCHSADAARVRGGLLLDTKSGWVKGGDSGPAIVPGKPEDSPLITAVRYDDADLKMPPKGKLTTDEIDTLVKWVSQGAPDPRVGPAKGVKTRVINLEEGRKFWSFQPLKAGPIPAVNASAWCRTPVDRFILSKLEARGLTPNNDAGRRQLIRRASYDLIGLPPTAEDVEAFVNDPSDDAYARFIDRLLDNPHYGERWGRHWLDVARFAESHGFEQDYDRPSAYHYRDFVVDALNQDLPFDTFVKWQLAGDEFAPENLSALKATGFLAAGVHSTQITASQVEKERYDELDDIAGTVGTAMLGLTIGCARCHDHKFDPIPQKDYYRLVSTFTKTVRTEVDLDLDPSGNAAAKAAFDAEHAALVAAFPRFESEELPRRLAKWEAERPRRAAEATWVILDPVSAKSLNGATFTKKSDGSYVVGGKNATFDTYTFVVELDAPGATSLRVEALADPAFVESGPGRAANGNFDLTDVRVSVAPNRLWGSARPVALSNPRATFEQKNLPARATIDDDKKSGWAVDPKFGQNHALVFDLPEGAIKDEHTSLTIVLDFQGNQGHNIGRPRFSVSYRPRPASIDGTAMSQQATRILATPRDRRTPEQNGSLLSWYRTIDDEWKKRSQAIEEHAKHPPKPKTTKALISSEGLPAVRLHTQGADFLEKTHFLKRGDPNQKLDEATQSFLQILMAASEQERRWQTDPPKGWRTSYRRTALANWITDVDQGAGRLLARVIVNRLWQHHFGRGIVTTPSDFGAQGERPSHPELLDWLASELIRNGWRLKPLHKLIMTSSVYREDARIDTAKAKLDHENTLFWRQTRQRLESEIIRDAMLSVAGALDERMFGPGTLDEAQRRRSVYFMIKRSHLIPMMLLFDSPDALQGLAVRSSTTIAPQSLLLMNNPVVRSWADAFAGRITGERNVTAASVVPSAYALALSRPPSADELADGTAFLEQQAAIYRGEGKPRPFETAVADFCQVILSLNEFVYVD